ncbi:MAG: hypothetical protein H7838_09340 [Magnetococcus sp. DMHC-8]
MNLPWFEQMVKEHCGLMFDGARRKVLERVIQERMTRLAMETLASYAACVQGNPLELEILVSHLTINETYFLREPAAIDLLTERLFPDIMAQPLDGRKIVIISAGCATGEEPYSLAIRLLEKFGAAVFNFTTILGLDVDVRALEIARAGIYGRHSFRGVNPDFKKNHFDRIGPDRFQIREIFRKNVAFHACNLLKKQEIDKLQVRADIVFYRNVSIYFNDPVRRAIFENFATMLNEGGYVIVSSVEVLHHDFGILTLNEQNGVFFFQKHLQLQFQDRRQPAAATGQPAPLQRPGRPGGRSPPTGNRVVGSPPVTAPPAVRQSGVPRPACACAGVVQREEPAKDGRQREKGQGFEQALGLALQSRLQEALPLIRQFVQEHDQMVAGHALLAAILVELQQYEEAKTRCRTILQMAPWHVEARLLLGLVARQEADGPESLAQFTEAAYLDPQCWLAHFYLAEACRLVGNRERAIREYRIAENILKNGGKPNHGLTLFPLSCSAEQLLHLCSSSMTSL